MPQRESNRIDIKKLNRNRVFRLIYGEQAISKPEIAHRLDMSLPTVIQYVKSLQDDGFVQECGVLSSNGGRRAVALSCVFSARHAVGLDITRNHVSAVLIDLAGNITDGTRREIAYRDGAEYARALGEIVEILVAGTAVPPASILGAGISMAGISSADGSTLVYSHVLQTANLRCADIGKQIPYQSLLCNDAVAAGIAESWTLPTVENCLYLSLSNTVGGAIILDRSIHQGDNQRSGEFGHITLERGGKLCYCGKRGCLDSYCAATLLSAAADGSLSDFFQQLEQGNPRARFAWERYLDDLAVGVNNLRMCFDCDIIIGGYVGAHLEDAHLEELRGRAAALNTFEGDGAYIKACRYKREAAAVGAALLHIKPFLDAI